MTNTDRKALQRRDTRVSEMSVDIEAAMAPDLNEVNGRYAPRGCRRRRLGVENARIHEV